MSRNGTESGSWRGRRDWVVFLALIAVVLLSQSSCLDEDDSERLGTEEAAAEVEHDVCQSSDLDFANGAQTCAGPWTYKVYDKQTSPFNLCSCQTYKTCSREEVQPDYHLTVRATRTNGASRLRAAQASHSRSFWLAT